MNNAEFLRSLAQNDYMIDNHFLDSGARLSELADALETAARNIRTLRAAYPEYGDGPQMWDSTLALIEGAADSASGEQP